MVALRTKEMTPSEVYNIGSVLTDMYLSYYSSSHYCLDHDNKTSKST